MSDLTERLAEIRDNTPTDYGWRATLDEAIEELKVRAARRGADASFHFPDEKVERWRKNWPREAQHVFGRILVVPHSDAEDALARVEAELRDMTDHRDGETARAEKERIRANNYKVCAEGLLGARDKAQAERDEALDDFRRAFDRANAYSSRIEAVREEVDYHLDRDVDVLDARRVRSLLDKKECAG